MNTNNLKKEIEKTKQKLIKKVKTKGLYENFGDKEYRELINKCDANPFGNVDQREQTELLFEFYNWCTHYTG